MSTAPVQDDTPIIAPADVHQALLWLRQANPLWNSSLIQLAQLRRKLREERIELRRDSLEWALGKVLEAHIRSELTLLRGNSVPDAAPQLSQERQYLAEDFSADSVLREAWSSLYYRYISAFAPQVQEMAKLAGVSERHIRRRLARGYLALAERMTVSEREAVRAVEGLAGAPLPERVVTQDLTFAAPATASPPGAIRLTAARSTPPAAFATLLAAVRDAETVARIAPDDLQAALRYAPNDLAEYRLSRIATWSQPRHRLDERFVGLSLWLDQGENAQPGSRWRPEARRFDGLDKVLADRDEAALVLLGAPGTGKSTLLRRLELDTAIAGLQGDEKPITFFASLSQYPGGEPADWLTDLWHARYPALPDLGTMLAEGRMLLLLDGLNEMPHDSPATFRSQVQRWRNFLSQQVAARPGNRAVLSCRTLDYSAPISGPQMRVPQLRIEPLSEAQIRLFLHAHNPACAEALWAALAGSSLRSVFRTPFVLRLLVEQVDADGEVPQGRAALFTGLVRRALARELERNSDQLASEVLLTARDRRRMTQLAAWASPFALPEDGLLFGRLAELALQFQLLGGAAGGAPRLPYEAARALIEDAHADEVLAAGAALGLVEEDLFTDEIGYTHQLFQEYFAARVFARNPEFGYLRSAWQSDDVSPPLEETLVTLGSGDSLPGLPSTGWEEVGRLAAAMAPHPGDFLVALATVNLPLAGVVAADAEVGIGTARCDDLRQRLVARLGDDAADLRARIAAGLALGVLGDPRLQGLDGPDGPYLLPRIVEIPAGNYPVGSDDGIAADESPAHHVSLAAFKIAQMPVTNAEWAFFVSGGGYDDQRWWDTPAAAAWQRGEGTAAGNRWSDAYWRRQYLADPDLLAHRHNTGRLTARQMEDWLKRLALGGAAFEADLAERWPDQRYREPAFWHDEAFNNPAQPVTGISWFEARAYCRWLAVQSSLAIRLPSEAEWEAAARGSLGRRFAWGEAFEVSQCNTAECRIGQPTPVGIYPAAATPEGLLDMTGNVYEWTSSLYGRDPYSPDFAYPYDPSDGREDPAAPSEVLRVARGGSWAFDHAMARAANRGPAHPALRSDVGLRVVVGEEHGVERS